MEMCTVVKVICERARHGSRGNSPPLTPDPFARIVYTSYKHWGWVMVEAVLDIKHWGNSLGVRLPVAVARAAHLHADKRVRIQVEDGRVIIVPMEDAPLTLAQRLVRFDPARHGGEAMVAAPVGAERW